MKNKNDIDQLKNPMGINIFPKDRTTFKLDKTNAWVHELLVELNENGSGLPLTELVKRTFLDIEFESQRNFKQTMGEYILLNGSIKTEYFTDCVHTLKLMKESLEIEFKLAILDQAYQDEDQYKDQIEIYIDNDLWDLHFYSKRQVDLKELFHELLHLNLNPYPSRQQEIPGQEPGIH